MNYTKGEWRYTIIGLESKVVDERLGIIAHVSERNSLAEIEANAYLISAAPDMYEALKEAFEKSHNPEVEIILMKALAKAEGKEV